MVRQVRLQISLGTLVGVLNVLLISQSGIAAEPAALARNVQPLNTIERVGARLPSMTTIQLEDEQRERDGLAPRYAIPNPVSITPGTHGNWENLRDGTMLWRLRVESPGALSINLGFTRYVMPPGGQLLIYAADGSQILRPFTADDNESHSQLWTPPVISDSIVVELTLPTNEVGQLELELTSINVGYRGFGEMADGSLRSGSCNVDVICSEGDGWRDQIQSVNVISTGGSTFCTGFMVNNTANDLTPYFMTAKHCGITSSNAASLVVFWNYENSTCRVPGSPASGGPGDGSLNQFQTGSFFRSSYTPSDFTLVELDDPPDSAFEVFFAGWDRSNADATQAIAIHHPNTDEKRISFEFDPTTTTAYLGTASPADGTHVRVADWDLGTTEPGSSGSPLFNQDQRIIGQLHGGYAACGNNTADWYGRFSVSWTGGGTSSTRLSDWLDPGNTGAMTINGTGLDVPPVTENVNVMLNVNSSGMITLTGFDANLEPLDFIVTSLPTQGELFDASDIPAGAIASVPYVLTGKGNQVLYRPSMDYIGSDGFSFKANDGGTPPGGGDSNISSASILVVQSPPQITTSALPEGAAGQTYGPEMLQVSGGQPPLTWELVVDVPYNETVLGSNDFTETGVAQGWNRDDGFWRYILPFTFPYYGQDYAEIRIWSNGFIDFGSQAGSSYANSTQSLMDNKIIAPLWDDLVTNLAGQDIFLDESIANQVTVRWKGGTYVGNNPVDFAVTLHDTGKINFHYGPTNATITATVGISNGDGVSYSLSTYSPATSLTNADSVQLKQPDVLAPGLSVSPVGELAGIPTKAGDYQPVFRVTDSLDRTDKRTLSLTVGSAAPGDFDGDGDVDLDDFAAFVDCITGPESGPYTAGCETLDVDSDGDVDMADFQGFQQYYTGSL